MRGYFSKEKKPFHNYNVSCLLTLPQFMNHGYGRFLIDFSYLLTKFEGKIGSPEKPLSDLGLISYRNYWISIIVYEISKISTQNKISIQDISNKTGIMLDDIISTMQYFYMIKLWKGKHVVVKNQVNFKIIYNII
jgi:histone acetyltransferase MYST2